MYKDKFVTAIIAAAGMGTRMQTNINKQFLKIGDVPVLSHTIKKIEACDYIDFLLIVIKPTDILYLSKIINEYEINLPYKIVYGGESRQDSIYHGLLNMPKKTDIVITHDGARPFVEVEKIYEVIEATFESGSATLANRVKDTIKVSQDGVNVDYTPNREKLWAIQTPQGFLKDIIVKAYEQAYEEGYFGTDDCSLVEKTGKKVKLILNNYKNIKITTKEDLIIAKIMKEVEDENRNRL